MANILDIFKGNSARSRLIIVAVVAAGFLGAAYLASNYLGGGAAVNKAAVANAPAGLQSVPGGQLSPEYYRAVKQTNEETAKQSQLTGSSSVSTLVNVPGQNNYQSNCTVMCGDGEGSDTTDEVNTLLRSGKLSQQEATQLLNMAKNNVPVSEYAANLERLVKEGKITPEEARKLLAQYKNQHAKALVAESSQLMDGLIKSGKLPVEVANQLLDLQKKNVTPQEYAQELARLVKEGKISPDTAAQLLAQYSQQKGREAQQASASSLQDMARAGQITPDVADDLSKLQAQNVPVDQYAAELNRLVAQGKMTPATAAELLAKYKAQKGNLGPAATLDNMVAKAQQNAEGAVADLVRQGKLPPDAAAQLLQMQKSHVSPQDYAKYLDQLVKEGKINPADAKKLLDDYVNGGHPGVNPAVTDMLHNLLGQGKISPDTAAHLEELQKNHVTPQEYAKYLDQLVKEGKITPADAKKLLDSYTAGSPQADQDELGYLQSQGKLPAADAAQLVQLQKSNVPPQAYAKYLDQLVREGKITPDEAKKLLNQYTKLQGLRSTAATLQAAQANNVTAADYQGLLDKAVAPGILTPDEAGQLLKEYQNYLNPPLPLGNGPTAASGTNPDFAALQQRLAAEQSAANAGTPSAPATASAPDLSAQFAAAEAQAAAAAERQHKEHVQALMTSMSGQAQQLITSWQSPAMVHREGIPPSEKKGSTTTTTTTSSSASGQSGGVTGEDKPPLIKAGTIYYAVLTTAVDSDYPDTPVMATIVDGPFKGAHLIGKLSLAQGMDKLSLNFNLMDEDSWPKSKTINAFAMDPDTARTVMASNVNHHYMLRYGTMFANSFLTGYSNGITQAGTSTTGIFGTSSVHPSLSPGNKIAVGLGQVGTAFSSAIGSYINTPTTVKINSGVGIGLLFVSDVTA